eukprot:2786242-Rhodomonas_salina.2
MLCQGWRSAGIVRQHRSTRSTAKSNTSKLHRRTLCSSTECVLQVDLTCDPRGPVGLLDEKLESVGSWEQENQVQCRTSRSKGIASWLGSLRQYWTSRSDCVAQQRGVYQRPERSPSRRSPGVPHGRSVQGIRFEGG